MDILPLAFISTAVWLYSGCIEGIQVVEGAFFSTPVFLFSTLLLSQLRSGLTMGTLAVTPALERTVFQPSPSWVRTPK